MKTDYKVNEKHKDRLFRRIFQEKKNLLELYNAVNGTDYTDENALEINTIEDVVYMGMKNDLSFLIGNTLQLYEHQSTYCENMPLRSMLYMARVYEGYIEENEMDVYSSKQLKVSFPQCIMFYNGTQNKPEREILKLSSAYLEPEKSKGKKPCLEFEVEMLNINYGKNRKLLEKCEALRDYAVFIHKIRIYQKKGFSLKEATDFAVEECIHENILKGFLSQHRAEVVNMVLTEYDEERHINNEKTLSRAEGIAEGLEKGKAAGITETLFGLVKDGLLDVSQASKRCQMSEEEFLREYEKCGK